MNVCTIFYHTELSECVPLVALLELEFEGFAVLFIVLVGGFNGVFVGDDIDSNLTLLLFWSPTVFEKLPACVTALASVFPRAELFIVWLEVLWPRVSNSTFVFFLLGNVYKLSSGGGNTISHAASNDGDVIDAGGGSNWVKDCSIPYKKL